MTGAGDQSDLGPLFAPRRIAIVGASHTPGKLGTAMVRSLEPYASAGGSVAHVNRRGGDAHPSIEAAVGTGPIDLAILCVPAAVCPDLVGEAAAVGVGAAVICSGGFSEAGGDGVDLQRRLVERARAGGIRLLGPNTSGFIVPGRRLTASFVPGVAEIAPGSVAIVAASGGVNHAVAFLLAEAGHGVSLAVGLGNAVDVTAPDVLDHLAADPTTTAVALHIESVSDGPRLVDAVGRLTAHKPVVALVVGRNDVAAFAESHTGRLATSWRTTRSALAQAGAVVVDDERELVDAVGALSVARSRPCASPTVGIVTAQAGPGLLLLDDLRGRDIGVPELGAPTREVLSTLLPPLTFQRNPVDTGRPGPELGRILAAVAGDPVSDVVASYALHEPEAVDLVAAAIEGRVDDVPLVVGVGGSGAAAHQSRSALIAAGIAAVVDPRGVAAATAALVADARARHRRDVVDPSEDGPAPRCEAGRFDEAQAKDILDELGLVTVPRQVCDDRTEAVAAFQELGAPVAVKLLDAAVLHKTEIGGVHLDIRTVDELEGALDALERAGAKRFLVEAMAPSGVDLVVGAHRDPVFGPIVMLGIGGTQAEAIADVSIRLAPLRRADAVTMPSELAGRRLLHGWRNGPTLNEDELARTIVAIGRLLVENPRLDTVEVNPLRLTARGLVALDAVITTDRRSEDA